MSLVNSLPTHTKLLTHRASRSTSRPARQHAPLPLRAIATPERSTFSFDSDEEDHWNGVQEDPVNQLEALRSMTTVVADTGSLADIARFRPVDCTTNPSLVLKALTQHENAHLMHTAIAEARTSRTIYSSVRQYVDVADRLEVALGAEILRLIDGRVSSEVDAHLSYDENASYDKALRLLDLYAAKGVDPSRVYIKMASTWEGIRACERLQKEGISCNMTLLFNLAQAAACADAGAALISPFVGRIRDWHMKKQHREFSASEDPGVLSVQRIYSYLKLYGYKTIVMGASFRTADEIRELAGIDYLTVAPKLLEELESCTDRLPRKLHPDMRLDHDDSGLKRLELGGKAGEARFRAMMADDLMASELLASGIQQFSHDQLTLEANVAALAEVA